MSKKLILLIGAPASGKTTDGSLIAKNHPEITNYSLGNLLKEEIEKHSKLGKINNDYISKGQLVPTAIAIDTIMDALRKSPTDIVLLDGFPREEEQMKIFSDILNGDHSIELDSVIEIRVSKEVAKQRVGNDELFEEQMKVYQDTIENIETFYNKDNILKVIDGEQNVENVVSDIDEFLKSHIAL